MMDVLTKVFAIATLLLLTACGDNNGVPRSANWEGCGEPRNATLDDYLECKDWQREKRGER